MTVPKLPKDPILRCSVHTVENSIVRRHVLAEFVQRVCPDKDPLSSFESWFEDLALLANFSKRSMGQEKPLHEHDSVLQYL